MAVLIEFSQQMQNLYPKDYSDLISQTLKKLSEVPKFN